MGAAPAQSRIRPETHRSPSGLTAIVLGLVLAAVALGTASASYALENVPELASMSPTSGPAGTTVTIDGRNLSGVQSVRFHGTPATKFTLLSSTRLTAVVPQGATSGKISVVTPAGTYWSRLYFSVTAGTAPAPAPAPTGNVAPAARMSVTPTSTSVGTAVSFNGSASSDTDGSIASYAWNYGDGTSGTGATASHAYRAAGTYTTRLTVTDNMGATGTASTTIAVGATSAPPPPSSPPSGNSVVLVDQPFVCTGPVNLDLVRVTMRNVDRDAVTLGSGCTGRIGRVEVQTWKQDGIKVQNQANPAHDLVIEGGYVKAWALTPGAHQDGIQVMGGSRITLRNLRVDVVGAQNLFIARGGSGATTPTDIVCEYCTLGPNVATPLFVATSLRSGARNSFVCTASRFGRSMSFEGAIDPVNVANYVAVLFDSRCWDITGASPF